MQLDQNQSLLNLLLKLGDDRSKLTLYVHHALADAHHVFSLLEELFTRYTDAVVNGDVGPVTPSPAPESLEQVLEKRGMGKKARSGLERFMPLIFAYDLPTSVPPPLPANPDVPQEIPTARIRLTEQETADLVEFGLANQLSLNSLVAAAILLTEWERRNTPHIPIPYLYPVDLRYLVSPPVSDTGSTNPMGVATFVAEITPETDILELARNIVASFRADLSDGVIQQSVLHFSLQYQGSPPGLPPMVLCTDAGPIPAVQTPPGLEIDDFRSEMHCPARTPVDMYSCRNVRRPIVHRAPCSCAGGAGKFARGNTRAVVLHRHRGQLGLRVVPLSPLSPPSRPPASPTGAAPRRARCCRSRWPSG